MRSHELRRPPFLVDELVLELVDNSAYALGAYEIARELTGNGRSVAPTQAYRALARLLEGGRIGKIEGLNAYCPLSDRAGTVIFCRQCRNFIVVDGHDLAVAVKESAKRLSFTVHMIVAEVSGVCATCAAGQTS